MMITLNRRPVRSFTVRVGIAILTSATAFGLAILAAPPAAAHNYLVETTPEDGSTVTAQPGTIELVFDQYVQDQFTQVVVLDADENSHQAGDPKVTDNVVTQDVGDLPEGEYTVSYRIVSADGHPVSGTVSFTMAAGASGVSEEPAPAGADDPEADSESGGGTSSAVLIGGGAAALLVVAGIAYLGLGSRRRTGPATAQHDDSDDSDDGGGPSPEDTETR